MWDARVVELCDPRRLTTSPMMMYFLGVIMQALLIPSRCAPPPALPGTAANRSRSEWADLPNRYTRCAEKINIPVSASTEVPNPRVGRQRANMEEHTRSAFI